MFALLRVMDAGVGGIRKPQHRIAAGWGGRRQIGIYKAFPPDTLITCPVIILACLLARNKTVSAISSG